MAKKITSLTAIDTLTTSDLIPVVDVSADQTKSATVAQVIALAGGGGGGATPNGNAGDILTSDGAGDFDTPITPPAGDLVGTSATQTLTNKTLTSPVLTTPSMWNTGLTFRYIFGGSAIAANRSVTLPLLTGDDTFVFAAHSQTLTNKTINGSNNTISNVAISTAVSGLGTGVATFLGTPSSANLLAALTTKTGTGNAVFATSPTISGPTFTGTVVHSGTATTEDAGTYLDLGTVKAEVSTTDDTETSLYSFTVPDNAVTMVDVAVVACQSTSAAGAAFVGFAHYRRDGGTASLVDSEVTTRGGSAWTVDIDLDTSTARVRVTGAAATTIRWTAQIRIHTTTES